MSGVSSVFEVQLRGPPQAEVTPAYVRQGLRSILSIYAAEAGTRRPRAGRAPGLFIINILGLAHVTLSACVLIRSIHDEGFQGRP